MEKMSGYPAPRYPRLKRPKSVDELMPKARLLVGQPPGKFEAEAIPSYGIKPGDKILWVAQSESDPMVLEALCRAIREKGARVDLLQVDSTPFAPPGEEWAAHEAIAVGQEEGEYSYYYSKAFYYIGFPTVREMVKSEKYTLVIGGFAGPLPPDSVVGVPWRFFRYHALENWASPAADLPATVIQMINDKVDAQIKACQVMRLTDPEGTDIKWTNYDDKRPFIANHLLIKPYNIGYGFGGKDDTTGVVAGTTNHLGVFPHIKAYLEGGQVVRVESGGKYGDVWREKLEKYRNLKMPPVAMKIGGPPDYQIKDPGFFWFFEGALGTLPGVVPARRELFFQSYVPITQTLVRAGHIHCGFGSPTRAQGEMIKAGLPWVHVHIHCWFATLQGTDSKGKAITIVDKGHLTALDDPEVRALTAKSGDPDKLLTEAWIPAIPGINVPGDYMKDYGRDPISWVKKQAIEHPMWID